MQRRLEIIVKLDTTEGKGNMAERREVMKARKKDVDTDTNTIMDTHKKKMMTIACVAS